MPSSLCCVPHCSNRGGHTFPTDVNLSNLWLIAIKQDKWAPNKYSIVCRSHFMEEDYSQETIHGLYIFY